ncbi:hypothetical protein [Aliagarivorans taiwanensis]|uniref:hypothetical protein n=1 Tax=Aliagarivorans taiwanensis TaxID=561966 RepID=UPI000422FA92|nr:hypothetical protein [Aliagarivorans taiwanensis]
MNDIEEQANEQEAQQEQAPQSATPDTAEQMNGVKSKGATKSQKKFLRWVLIVFLLLLAANRGCSYFSSGGGSTGKRSGSDPTDITISQQGVSPEQEENVALAREQRGQIALEEASNSYFENDLMNFDITSASPTRPTPTVSGSNFTPELTPDSQSGNETVTLLDDQEPVNQSRVGGNGSTNGRNTTGNQSSSSSPRTSTSANREPSAKELRVSALIAKYREPTQGAAQSGEISTPTRSRGISRPSSTQPPSAQEPTPGGTNTATRPSFSQYVASQQAKPAPTTTASTPGQSPPPQAQDATGTWGPATTATGGSGRGLYVGDFMLGEFRHGLKSLYPTSLAIIDITTGPLEGARVIYTPTLAYDNYLFQSSKIYWKGYQAPFNSILVTPSQHLQPGFRSGVNHHTMYRWGMIFVHGMLKGATDYINSTGTDTTINDNVIISSKEFDPVRMAWSAGGGVAEAATDLVKQETTKPPTVWVNAHDAAGIMMTEDWNPEWSPRITENTAGIFK